MVRTSCLRVKKARTIFITKNEMLANIGSGMLILLAFLPYANFVFGRWINYMRFAAVVLFMMGVLARDKKIFMKMVAIFSVAICFNILYYYQLWHLQVSFQSFMIKSMLCWVYSTFGIYYSHYGSLQEKKGLLYLFMLVLLVTSITTPFALKIDPLASRILGNAGYDRDAERMFYSLNTATWGIIFGMAFALPMLIVWVKKTRSFFCFFVICSVLLCILRAQVTFAVIFAAIFLICTILRKVRIRNLVLAAALIILFVLFFMPLIADLIYIVYSHMDGSIFGVLKYKTYWIYQSLEQGRMYGGANGRIQLYMESITTFLKNPFFGYRVSQIPDSHVGLHSQVFDTLAATGLIGALPCFIAFLSVVSMTFSGIKNQMTRLCYFVAAGVLCLFACVNPVWYAPESFMSVFLLPSLVSGESANNKIYLSRRNVIHGSKRGTAST